MALVGPLLTLASAGISAVGSIMSGNAQSEQAKFQAMQEQRKAAEERAVATHDMQDMQHRADLVTSRQTALGAAQGGSATDPTVLNLMADTRARSFYDQQLVDATAHNRSNAYLDQAAQLQAQARSARTAGYLGAAGSIISGLGSAYKQYSKMPDPNDFAAAGDSNYGYGGSGANMY